MIRQATIDDAEQIVEIYNHYVLHTVVTFDEEPLSTATMKKTMASTMNEFPWIVYEKEDRLLGYAYANTWKTRSAYNYTVESTVYLQPEEKGKGIGSLLYKALISQLKEAGIHSVIGGIALPNDASIALHEKLGFKKVAHFKEVGLKFNQWVDVGYWELILNSK